MVKHSAKNGKFAGSEWLRRGFGRWVAHEERRLCRETIADVFGIYAAQLGGDGRSMLATSPVRHKVLIARHGSGALQADWRELPLESDSLDCIVLVHALEAAADPRAVLREAVRALRPEGRLIIIGFNRWSLLSLAARAPWRGRWLSVPRVTDWLSLLEMQPLGGAYAVFLPPWRAFLRRKWRMRWLEPAGRRWWPLAGGVFVLHTVKRRHSLRLILPTTFQPRGKAAGLAPYPPPTRKLIK